MIAIPNMEIPKTCGECEFNYNLEGGSYEWQECVLLNEDITHFDIARDDCPLIEIVTCGECKHHDEDGWGYGECQRPSVDYLRTADEDFCSYGERRANEHR